MSRNGGSGVLVATVATVSIGSSLLTSGLRTVVNQSHVVDHINKSAVTVIIDVSKSDFIKSINSSTNSIDKQIKGYGNVIVSIITQSARKHVCNYNVIKQTQNRIEKKTLSDETNISENFESVDRIKDLCNNPSSKTGDPNPNPTPPDTSNPDENNPPPIRNARPPIEFISENKRDTKDTIKNNVVEQLKIEIKPEVVKLNSEADSLGLDPVKRSQFIEQGHRTIEGEIRKQARSLVEEENKKYRNIILAGEVGIVAATAADIALKDSGILENKDNNVSERVKTMP
ncbi:MAG: hypothetical protein V7K41_20505 [Nostoc sp.]|uniref:hypothetical protein n=1 Tax=Nostoc sp. TaxID=1180 RepID=UPI002FFC3455